MKSRYSSVFLTLIIAVFLLFVSPIDSFGIDSHRTQQTTAELNSFVDNVLYQGYLLSPIEQTYWGDRSHNSEWDDISEEGEAELAAIWQAALLSLRSQFNYNELDYQGKITYRLFEEYAERHLAYYEYRNHVYQLTHREGPHLYMPQVLTDAHLIQSYSDATAYISRLRGFDDVFDQLIERLNTSAAMGVILPDFIIPQVITSARNVITGRPFDNSAADNFILADFKQKVNALAVLSQTQRNTLIADAENALVNEVKPAYERLIAYLQAQLNIAPEEAGVWRFPDGDDYYRMLLRYQTTTKLTPNDIYQLGIRNVRKTHREMKQIMKQVNFESNKLQDFFEYMRTSKRFYYKNTNAGRARFLREAEGIVNNMKTHLPEMFITLPQTDLIVKAVEPYREETAEKAFYQSGSSDGSRPGVFYLNTYDMRNQPVYELEALAYHEGVPGHHLQISIAQEKDFGSIFRSVVGHTGYIEGWALYCEQLGKEMGMYQDPYSDFGRLSMQAWRAARLVVDTGIHYKRWTRQEAIDYLVENTPSPESECVIAIDRYVVQPGQATCYMIGKLKILKLRETAQHMLGNAFDLREFHEVLLTNGSVTLEMLEEIINDWIAEKLSQVEAPAA
jgi:uncharacterized protein (DUF885 family)